MVAILSYMPIGYGRGWVASTAALTRHVRPDMPGNNYQYSPPPTCCPKHDTSPNDWATYMYVRAAHMHINPLTGVRRGVRAGGGRHLRRYPVLGEPELSCSHAACSGVNGGAAPISAAMPVSDVIPVHCHRKQEREGEAMRSKIREGKVESLSLRD